METEKTTYTRREFNQLFAMLIALFTGAGTAARAGIDNTLPVAAKKRKRGKLITPEEAAGAALSIDFPADEGWSVIHRLNHDDWKRLIVDADNVSPKIARQLAAAKAAPYGTPVLCRVFGDPIAVLDKCRYFQPGEPDDREYPDKEEHDFDERFSNWRLEWFGDDIRRIAPDNTSWMQHRLAHGPEFSGREIAFHEHWQYENANDRYGINYGCGAAQDLMLSIYKYEKPENFEPWLTNRERKILATFVQWLGTNCGQSFLHEVKRKGGILI
jgi:hypothetical protein